MTTAGIAIDPVDFELINNRLAAAADEMAISLRRAAYSAAAREMMDFSTAICDRNGHVVVQGVGLAIQLGLLPNSVPAIAETYVGDLEDGDVVILNDPYLCGAHLNDLLVIKPVFASGRLIAFVAAIMHHLDVGGRVPGSIAADNRVIYEDGLRLPPLKLIRGGDWHPGAMAILKANVRTPNQNLGDLRAQIAALRIGERELHEICAELGAGRVEEFMDELLAYSERLARSAIEAMPDGSYAFEDWMDDDGVGGGPLKVKVEVRIIGDRIVVDFAGSHPQRPCGLNSPLNSTKSIVYAAVRAAMGGRIPENSGLYRTIEVLADEGSIVNATHPMAVGSRGLTLYRIADALLGALAQAVPARLMAAGDGGPLMLVISGRRSGNQAAEPFLFLELVTGGWGARSTADGMEAVPHIGVNHSNIPAEVVEAEFPIQIETYSMLPDTEGPGMYRGCLASVRAYRVLTDCDVVVRSDRRAFLPWGLDGGGNGAPSQAWVIRADGSRRDLPTMTVTTLEGGDTLYYSTPSGGGWGPPLEREARRIADDVLDGKLSLERARSVYGRQPPPGCA